MVTSHDANRAAVGYANSSVPAFKPRISVGKMRIVPSAAHNCPSYISYHCSYLKRQRLVRRAGRTLEEKLSHIKLGTGNSNDVKYNWFDKLVRGTH
eukprot:6023941-Amphidinium_carterae.1